MKPPAACCPEGEKVLAVVEFVAKSPTGYQCPVHGWQWVGEPPQCVCDPPELRKFPCSHAADGPDRLCKECRDGGHMRPRS